MKFVNVGLQISKSCHRSLNVTVQVGLVLSQLKQLLLGFEIFVLLHSDILIFSFKPFLKLIILALSFIVHLLQRLVKINFVFEDAALSLELLLSMSEPFLSHQKLFLQQEHLVFLLG
jgi:hypothetical protein